MKYIYYAPGMTSKAQSVFALIRTVARWRGRCNKFQHNMTTVMIRWRVTSSNNESCWHDVYSLVLSSLCLATK